MMKIRLKDYFHRLGQDYLFEKLKDNTDWQDSSEKFFKYLPLLLLKEEVRLISIDHISADGAANRFKMRYRYTKKSGKSIVREHSLIFKTMDGTLRHQFFFETYYNGRFKKNMEWYLHEKELQETLSSVQ